MLAVFPFIPFLVKIFPPRVSRHAISGTYTISSLDKSLLFTAANKKAPLSHPSAV
jgi:hypothetical protein